MTAAKESAPAPAAPAPAVPEVYAAISRVSAQLAMEGIGKDRRNDAQKFNFRGIDDVLNALAPMLAANRLLILPRMLNRIQTDRANKAGGAIYSVVVEAEFDFTSAVDGSRVTVKMFGEAMDSADKATNKAMSAAYKYAAIQAFCIPTEGDNDADAHHHEPIALITAEQAQKLSMLAVDAGVPLARIFEAAGGITALSQLPAAAFSKVEKKLLKSKAERYANSGTPAPAQ